MPEYADAADRVRRARQARDAARDDLYKVQLHRLAIDRAQRRGTGVENDRPLRLQLEAATTRRQAVAKQLESLRQTPDDIVRLRRRLEAAPAERAALDADIAKSARALERADKPADRDRLQTSIQALQAKRALLDETTSSNRAELADARGRQKRADELGRESAALNERVAKLRDDLAAAEERARNTDFDAARKTNKAAADDAARAKRDRDRDVRLAIETLYDGRTPDQLIESWDDALPITLLPLRLETRWKVDGGPGVAQELWVRVYPDDVCVNNHEPVLTDAEVERGRQYWIAIRDAKQDPEDEAVAWDALARRLGGNRAAWVALRMRPRNWDAAAADPDATLDFPEQTTKPNPWTSAPHSRVLPDRFVLLAWRGNELRINKVGEPVDDIVILGPSPIEATGGDESLSRDAGDQTLQLGNSFDWIRNFDRAVERGLAFREKVTADDVRDGFDRLLVLGLKLSADAPEAQSMVEGLIDNHHYSQTGFELLRQGTPTNNTEDDGSGFTRGSETGVAGTSPDRFAPANDRMAASDGQRLADFLGISYAPLLRADGADYADHSEAVAMNRALVAGTLGYYLDHMLNEVVDEGAIGALRRHFTDFVTGRGPLAAFRVGSQPYGVIPTSSLARWQPHKKDLFDAPLVGALRIFDSAWTSKLATVAQIGDQGDASANLLKVLGLHPTSVEFHQRVGYSFDYLRNLDSFAWDGANFGDTIKMILEGMSARRVLRQLGYSETRADGTPKPSPLLLQLIWRHYQTALDAKQLIDGQPLSETDLIKPYNAAGKNYIDWLSTNAADAAALEAQNFSGASRPGSLLYMLLHFSLVMEGARAIHHWLGKRDITADEMVRSRKFLNVTGKSPSIWEVFRAPANRIVDIEPSSAQLLGLMHTPQQANDSGQSVQEQRAALASLRGIPTARLERALVEHIDTLSYRLDAWETSLFTRRLHRQRSLSAPVEERRTGVYLGAYGYLERVRPRGRRRTKVPGEDNLYRETGNGGYVHAPSINHATAAALLRNGYLTHATPADPNALAVNLSSGRVQRAKYLIEGIRGGQSLEVLLGVQFERGLHDWTTRPVNPVIVNQLKPLFRTKFPIVRTRVPQANDAAGGAAEVHEDYQVVNGLTLARTTTPFPYGIVELSALTAAQQDAIRAEKAAIENTLDALRDVLTAESAYQLALGNFDRAAAVLQSVGGGTLPPDIEVLDTPRATGISFTQRLAVQFDSTVAANPWGAPSSARALLDPPLNAWLGDLLGAPDTIRCRVAAVDVDGAVLSDGGGPIEDTVSVAQLELQPVDFVYLIRSQTEPNGVAELETRVRYKFARDRGLSDETIVRITFADAGPGGPAGKRSFAEVLPLADRLRKLLGTARPLDARHFASASKDAPGDVNNPGRINTGELVGRVTARLTAIRNLFPPLQAATNTARASNNAAEIDAVRTELVRIARNGVSYAMPRSATGAAPAQRDALVQQADALLSRAATLGPATDQQLADAGAPTTTAERAVSQLSLAVKAWVGNDVVLLPRFVFGDVAAVTQADAARDQLLTHARDVAKIPLPVEEWLHGAACVRSLVHEFEMMRAMADAGRAQPLALAPLQLPFSAGDSWLGTQFPPATQVVHDTVSIVQHLPQGFVAAQPQCGLLIDEWTESVPARDGVTGLCFNFNAPNSAPAQAVLLAVTPDETGRWSWDDLVDSVLDTFRRAKLRGVEPDALGDLPGIGTLLPAVVAEFGASAASVSLDYSMVMNEIRIPVMAVMAAGGDGG